MTGVQSSPSNFLGPLLQCWIIKAHRGCETGDVKQFVLETAKLRLHDYGLEVFSSESWHCDSPLQDWELLLMMPQTQLMAEFPWGITLCGREP